MKTICNLGCKSEFEISSFKTEPCSEISSEPSSETLKNNKTYQTKAQMEAQIEATFFQCPHCGYKYISFYTNPKIRCMQAKMRIMLAKSDPRKLTKQQEQSVTAEIKRYKEKIKAEMDELRRIIEGQGEVR